MTKTQQDLLSAVLSLPPNERAEVAEHVLQSLEKDPDTTIDAAWAHEAERRIDLADQGEKGIPGDELMQKLRARVK